MADMMFQYAGLIGCDQISAGFIMQVAALILGGFILICGALQ